MDLQTEWVSLQRDGKSFSSYLARPRAAKGPLPGVIVIMEIWGTDPHMLDLTERFASAGYVAMCPDLYSYGGKAPAAAPERIEAIKRFMDSLPPGSWQDAAARDAAMAKLPPDERDAIAATRALVFGPKDTDGFVANLRAAATFLRAHPAVAGRRIGSTGYCMGGGLSLLLACREPSLAAASIYYGSNPPAAEIAAIRCPVRGFYGELDTRITGRVPELAAAMQEAGKDFESKVYPGAPHAFFNDTRASYHPEAARDAWARTLAFFAQTLSV